MRIQVKSYPIYEIGKRTNQEDALYPSPEGVLSDSSLFILCDGMGGHAAGEVASQTVCSAMSQFLLSHPTKDGVFRVDDFSRALECAYAALDDKDTNDEKKMGTTLAFVKIHKGGCFVAHIGDSRIYHIRPSAKRVLYVTRDHSLVNNLIDLGELTAEEARTCRQKNIITRALQPHQEQRVLADCTNLTDLKEGDYLYMCSDGMLEQMEDQEIVNILTLPKDDNEKIRILKGATMDNRDNHSAHLIKIVSVQDNEESLANGSDSGMKSGHRFLGYAMAVIMLILLLIAFYVFKVKS